MASDLRTVIRNIEDNANSVNYYPVVKKAYSAIKEYDSEREFENSIAVFKKLIEVATTTNNPSDQMRFLDHIKTRYLLLGKRKEYSQLLIEYPEIPKSPLSSFFNVMNASDEEINNFVLENIERQTIFGNFAPIDMVPFIEFDSQDKAIRLIEDYYETGRYIVSLTNKRTQLHQILNVDLGRLEEVNIVEREYIFKI